MKFHATPADSSSRRQVLATVRAHLPSLQRSDARVAHVIVDQPDVVIYNTALPAAFPNGRELVDDVVDLVGDPRVLMNDQPFPTANDVAFLTSFPYLAAPH